jgi:hypothetical protein
MSPENWQNVARKFYGDILTNVQKCPTFKGKSQPNWTFCQMSPENWQIVARKFSGDIWQIAKKLYHSIWQIAKKLYHYLANGQKIIPLNLANSQKIIPLFGKWPNWTRGPILLQNLTHTFSLYKTGIHVLSTNTLIFTHSLNSTHYKCNDLRKRHLHLHNIFLLQMMYLPLYSRIYPETTM